METVIKLLKGRSKPLGNIRWAALKRAALGKETDKGLIFRLFMYLILIDTAFIYIKPILYMVTTMVKDASNLFDPSVIWVPRNIYLGNLKEAYRMMHFPTGLSLSLIVSLSVAGLQILSCAIAGYAFARLEFPFKKLWFIALIFTFIMPPQVTILPSIVLFRELGWINTYWPMIIPALFGHGLKGALFVIIFRQFFATLPKEMEEAARIDGASLFRLFFRVILPISKPAIIVVFLFSLVWNWNDVYFPSMYMFGAREVPLSMSLAKVAASLTAGEEQGQATIFAESIKMAAGFLIIIPVLVIYGFTQRWFVEGVERTGLVE